MGNALSWGLFAFAVGALGSCSDPAGNAADPHRVPRAPLFSYDGSGTGCWPPSDTCHERPFTSEESQQALNAITTWYHNSLGIPECDNIISMAFDRIYTQNAHFWSDPPANYAGDSHRTLDPQLIHITALAMQTNEAFGRAMIHEASHLAGFNHPTAYYFEDECK